MALSVESIIILIPPLLFSPPLSFPPSILIEFPPILPWNGRDLSLHYLSIEILLPDNLNLS